MPEVPRFWGAQATLANVGRRFGTSGRRILMAAAGVSMLAIFAALAAPLDIGRSEIDKSPLGLAHALMEKGEYSRAAETLRAAWRAEPTEPLRMELARTLIGAGDNEGVLEALRTEFSDPSFEPARDYLRAEALIRLRRYDEAAALAEALAGGPADGRALLISGRAAYGAGRFDAAASLTGQALRAGGESLGDAWLFRARLALDANDFAAAKAAAARARESGAPAREIAAADIEGLIRGGDFTEASAAISALKAKTKRRDGPKDPLPDYLAALLEASRGDYVAAARGLRALDRWLDGLPGGPLLLAMVQDRAGDSAQAERRFRALLAETPKNPFVLAASLDRLIAAGRLEEARQLVDRAGPRTSPATEGFLRLAYAQGADDHDAAVAAAKTLAAARVPPSPAEIVFGPHSQAAREDRARYESTRALAEAARVLLTGDARAAGKAARAHDDPSLGPAMAGLVGELYLAAGEDERAAAVFDRALTIAPNLLTALKGRVRVAVREGDLAYAETLLGDAVEASPDFVAARELLARMFLVSGRPKDAAAVLAPVEEELFVWPDGALLYASALQDAGEDRMLVRFAQKLNRVHPADPATVTVLDWAGLYDAAAGAAREALLKAPQDIPLREAYRRLMKKAGRASESVSFLDALAERTAEEAAHPGSDGRQAHGPAHASGNSAEENIGDANSLGASRRAHLAAPEDAFALSRFGAALARAGKVGESVRVMREACFRAPFEGCAPGLAPRT